jgi:hypothetical protein
MNYSLGWFNDMSTIGYRVVKACKPTALTGVLLAMISWDWKFFQRGVIDADSPLS